MRISRDAYASLYGPTTGDRVRLGDTSLFLEIEKDFATYGEEVVFGGGKVIRDGQGQSQVSRAGGAPDLVITGAIVLDHWGVVKADVGVRDGRIVAIGKAGNPAIQDGVTPGLAIGPSTEIIAGEHRILTAGGIDAHIHFISPQQVWEALYSGVTTMIGGGTGPAEGTRATTCTSKRSATLSAASIVAGVVPQSSCSFSPIAPARICSSSAAGVAAFPLPRNPRFIGRPCVASIMRCRFHRPGVQVVARVPSAGPVPPPIIVVTPL